MLSRKHLPIYPPIDKKERLLLHILHTSDALYRPRDLRIRFCVILSSLKTNNMLPTHFQIILCFLCIYN